MSKHTDIRSFLDFIDSKQSSVILTEAPARMTAAGSQKSNQQTVRRGDNANSPVTPSRTPSVIPTVSPARITAAGSQKPRQRVAKNPTTTTVASTPSTVASTPTNIAGANSVTAKKPHREWDTPVPGSSEPTAPVSAKAEPYVATDTGLSNIFQNPKLFQDAWNAYTASKPNYRLISDPEMLKTLKSLWMQMGGTKIQESKKNHYNYLFEDDISKSIYQSIYSNTLFLIESQLTQDQIQQIFKLVADGAANGLNVDNADDAPSTNKTLIGRGAQKVSDAWNKVKNSISQSGPVSGFDTLIDNIQSEINKKLGGDSGFVSQKLNQYRKFANEHKIMQGAIYAVFVAALAVVSGSTGPMAVATLASGLKLVDRMLQGDKASSALWTSFLAGGVAAAGSSALQLAVSENTSKNSVSDCIDWQMTLQSQRLAEARGQNTYKIYISETGRQKIFKSVVAENIWSGIKSSAKKGWESISNKITYDKLDMNWRKSFPDNRPTTSVEVQTIVDFLKNQGVKNYLINYVMQQMGIPGFSVEPRSNANSTSYDDVLSYSTTDTSVSPSGTNIGRSTSQVTSTNNPVPPIKSFTNADDLSNAWKQFIDSGRGIHPNVRGVLKNILHTYYQTVEEDIELLKLKMI
jgi:hypothetical protein